MNIVLHVWYIIFQQECKIFQCLLVWLFYSYKYQLGDQYWCTKIHCLCQQKVMTSFILFTHILFTSANNIHNKHHRNYNAYLAKCTAFTIYTCTALSFTPKFFMVSLQSSFMRWCSWLFWCWMYKGAINVIVKQPLTLFCWVLMLCQFCQFRKKSYNDLFQVVAFYHNNVRLTEHNTKSISCC